MSESELRATGDAMPAEVVTTGVAVERVRVKVLGISLDRINLRDTMARIREACEARSHLQVNTVNLNFLTISRRIPAFEDVINGAGLSVTDGRILQWVTWFLGEPAPERITGHDLFFESVKLAVEKDYGIFLLGAGPGIAREVAEKLRRENPGLRTFGTDHGMFSADGYAENQDELDQQILEFKPDILFLALGAPKQERWIANHCERLGVSVALGVGSVFDVVSGRMKRAPRWSQKAGLESLVQLLYAPRRYAKRYLVDDPPTLLRVMGHVMRRRLFKNSGAVSSARTH